MMKYFALIVLLAGSASAQFPVEVRNPRGENLRIETDPSTPFSIVISTPLLGTFISSGTIVDISTDPANPTLIFGSDANRVSNITWCNESLNFRTWHDYADVTISTESTRRTMFPSQCDWFEGPGVYLGSLYAVAESTGGTIHFFGASK